MSGRYIIDAQPYIQIQTKLEPNYASLKVISYRQTCGTYLLVYLTMIENICLMRYVDCRGDVTYRSYLSLRFAFVRVETALCAHIT